MEQAFRTAKRERHCQKRKSCANMTIKTSVIWECPPISAADQAGRAKSVDFAERIIDFISLTNNLVHRVPLQGCPVNQPPMAAGEYVSVSSQTDTEQADLALERKGLEVNETFEHEELVFCHKHLNPATGTLLRRSPSARGLCS